MIYKDYEIVAEAITGRAVYKLDDNGELTEYINDVDCEPEPYCYGIVYKDNDGDIIDWCDTIDEAKQYIDKLKEEIK